MTEVTSEITAMQQISSALQDLDQGARGRVLRWAVDAFGTGTSLGPLRSSGKSGAHAGALAAVAAEAAEDFASLGDLVDAVSPDTTADRILTVGYWLHDMKGEQDFTSQSINDELKNMGHGVKNITDALSSLMARRPALVRQTRKTGKAQQARKRYALTEAGRKRIRVLLNDTGSEEE